ncbi:hypothetical protein FSST1_008846 [Fusarium sambucinum]
MSCTDNGISMMLVDSIFISNQVTPQTIGDVKLDFGTPLVDPVTIYKAPVTNDGPHTASPPFTTSSEVSPTDIDQTIESSVKFPTETAGNPHQPTDGSQNTDTEFTSHTQPPSDPNTAETASSIIPPILSGPNTVVTESQNEEVTSTPGTPANTPVTPVTSVVPGGTSVTSGTPGTPVPTRDAPYPSETPCWLMCIPKGDAFERNTMFLVSTVALHTPSLRISTLRCSTSSPLVNGEGGFTDVLIRESEIQTLDNTAPNQGFLDEQRCFQCNDYSLPPLFNPPTTADSQAEISSTTAPEEIGTRSTEATPTETRNIVCGYVGQYTGSGGPYGADHTAFTKQRKECRQACDGIRDYTLVTDEQAAYRAVWADPECDFDLISVPELSFPITTMAPVDSQPTTLATRTSQQPETTTTPAEVCLFNRGQSCTIAPEKLEAGTFCAGGAKFMGTQWKESREDYPYQDTLE